MKSKNKEFRIEESVTSSLQKHETVIDKITKKIQYATVTIVKEKAEKIFIKSMGENPNIDKSFVDLALKNYSVKSVYFCIASATADADSKYSYEYNAYVGSDNTTNYYVRNNHTLNFSGHARKEYIDPLCEILPIKGKAEITETPEFTAINYVNEKILELEKLTSSSAVASARSAAEKNIDDRDNKYKRKTFFKDEELERTFESIREDEKRKIKVAEANSSCSILAVPFYSFSVSVGDKIYKSYVNAVTGECCIDGKFKSESYKYLLKKSRNAISLVKNIVFLFVIGALVAGLYFLGITENWITQFNQIVDLAIQTFRNHDLYLEGMMDYIVCLFLFIIMALILLAPVVLILIILVQVIKGSSLADESEFSMIRAKKNMMLGESYKKQHIKIVPMKFFFEKLLFTVIIVGLSFIIINWVGSWVFEQIKFIYSLSA